MKEESVLNVLMYLFQNHMDDSCKLDETKSQLWPELEEIGFEHQSIGQAFDWLNRLEMGEKEEATVPAQNSFRVFSAEEQAVFDNECLAFLFFLERESILNFQTRELVINQVMELEDEGVDVSLIKWVTLMVLFNQPDQKDALTCMEFLVLEDIDGAIN